MDKYEQLKRLSDLKEQGALSEEEFLAEKNRILASDLSSGKIQSSHNSPTPKGNYAPCKVCTTGSMVRKKMYVLGMGGAIFRFLLVCPGVLLLLFGIIGMLGTREAFNETRQGLTLDMDTIRSDFSAKGVPIETIEDILDDGQFNGDLSTLSQQEAAIISEIETRYFEVAAESVGGAIGTSMVGGFVGFLLFGGVVLCGLGFLIGIRKWKLVCDRCGAAVNAA